jgi:hypothetical protein
MSKKDLTQLSKKELESMLAKKYGVDKYLNQRSQLLDLLGSKGETDIQTGFTGPETEALSIMFSNKAEGGLVNLLGGGKVNAPRQTDIKGQDHMLAYITPEEGGILKALGGSGTKGPMGIPQFGFGDGDVGTGEGDSDDEADGTSDGDTGTDETGNEDSTQGVNEDVNQEEEEDSARGGDYTVDDEGQFTGYGASYGKSIEDAVKDNPQLQGFLGKKISSLIDKGKVRGFEFDKKGNITGVTAQTVAPGFLGALLGPVTTYTGYGKGFDDMLGGGDDGSDTSEMIKKIVEEKKKEEDSPLTQEQIDYYTRGMGSATKPLKTLDDVNKYMSSLVGTTASPTGAKLSKDKKFLILPNGKIINLKTGKVQESMSGLELFAGGMI